MTPLSHLTVAVQYRAAPRSRPDLLRSLVRYEQLLWTHRWLAMPIDRTLVDGTSVREVVTWVTPGAMEEARRDPWALVIWDNIRHVTTAIEVIHNRAPDGPQTRP